MPTTLPKVRLRKSKRLAVAFTKHELKLTGARATVKKLRKVDLERLYAERSE